MAQTRPSPTLSRGFTRLGRFLAPYAETIRGCAVLREDVSDFPANFPEFRVVEGCKTNLYGARVVEARISCEIDIQALCERLQPLYTLGTVEEGWGSSDHQIQARETTAVDLVYQLPDGVQALLPNVTSYPLQRLDLVQHEDQSGVTGIAQHHEKPLQEVQGSEVIDVPLHPSKPLDGRAHIGVGQRAMRADHRPAQCRSTPGRIGTHAELRRTPAPVW